MQFFDRKSVIAPQGMDHLKTESLTEIAERLMELETVQDRIRYYVSFLEWRSQ